jgi:two-component system sensor histidine kinase UhpB
LSCIAREIAVRFNLIVGFSTVNGPLGGGTDCDAIEANLMWQKLSLRGRINLLLALGLTLGLAINIARLVVEAGPRVRAEDQSVIRLAREFVETIVPGLNEAADPEARLNQIVHDLSKLRHVSITRQGDASVAERSGDGGDERSPPAWFIALPKRPP